MATVNVEKNRYTVEPLYQWDINRTLEIKGLSVPSTPEIHFTNSSMDRAIVRQATMDASSIITVDIPNSLLQKPCKITVYVCVHDDDTFKSLYSLVIPIEARPRPTDYTIENTDQEIYSFNALENKINNILEPTLTKYEELNEIMEDLNEQYVENSQLLVDAVNNYETLNAKVDENYSELKYNYNNVTSSVTSMGNRVTALEDEIDNLAQTGSIDITDQFGWGTGSPSARATLTGRVVNFEYKTQANMTSYIVATISNSDYYPKMDIKLNAQFDDYEANIDKTADAFINAGDRYVYLKVRSKEAPYGTCMPETSGTTTTLSTDVCISGSWII